MQNQLIANRANKAELSAVLPCIENLVYAAAFENSLRVKLNTFEEFLVFLWGKPYVLGE